MSRTFWYGLAGMCDIFTTLQSTRLIIHVPGGVPSGDLQWGSSSDRRSRCSVQCRCCAVTLCRSPGQTVHGSPLVRLTPPRGRRDGAGREDVKCPTGAVLCGRERLSRAAESEGGCLLSPLPHTAASAVPRAQIKPLAARTVYFRTPWGS